MVSTVVPTFGLLVSPPAMVELQLCPRITDKISAAPKEIKNRLGMGLWKCPVFFKADLADADRTAVLAPDVPGRPDNGEVPRPLPLPTQVLCGASNTASHLAGAGSTRAQRCSLLQARRFRVWSVHGAGQPGFDWWQFSGGVYGNVEDGK